MNKLQCVIMRGGTSKGVFFHANELPLDIEKRTQTILRVMGSPDKRQVDGLGGADILSSKSVIIGPSSRPDADIDYIFGQVGITNATVDFNTLCGNLTAAVAPFAIDEGLVKCVEPYTNVRIWCPTVERYLGATVEVNNGKAVYHGDYKMDGVPGTGSKIPIDFSDTAGLITGSLLPTGNLTDVISVEGAGDIEVSVVDVSTVVAFVRGKDLGLDGSETPEIHDSNKDLINRMEAIRLKVAQLTDLAGRSPLLPMLAVVRSPMDYKNYVSGDDVFAQDFDIMAKVYAAGMMHKAYPVTGAIATGTAAKIPGTIAHECVPAGKATNDEVVIGHFSGLLPMRVGGQFKENGFELETAEIFRTARRIMEGSVYI
ncbi:2-methylaconitate cis-trans isomerase PrpF family protein [Desulfobacula toluolica]|uniref:PrpF: predicted 3-methylitaconate isomerase n=1 Tax=Desulfobacula toluolica (strain DSM 7467 / Tol2) TaxID=651182 RepID=K0NIW4_DESTT|nr:PrpF domain-containing protein [Desulfobacula toluolica]CCK81376.1 PrpF: predicted 3-methylitaconate isomerase [Desulfobacula toluolica Tol2]